MDRRTNTWLQRGLRSLLPLLVVWAFGSALLWILVQQDGIPYADLVLDPAQYGRRPWYVGLVSNLGILGWTTATVTSVVGAGAAVRGGRHGAAQFLRAGATLSGLLLLDDLFQLHIVVPDTLGQPKLVFYLVYGLLGGWWALASARELLRTRWPLLVAAVFALGGSVLVDVFGHGAGAALVVEDSAKFLGILAWALYFSVTTHDIVGSLASTPPMRPAPICPTPEPGGVVGAEAAVLPIPRS
ncbi:MAG: hypothetical protein AAFN30_04430 [Actinomycetota bacterium]